MRRGIPAVVITNPSFVRTAILVASAVGIPDLGIAEYPGAIDVHSDAEVRDNIEKLLLDRIIDGLSKPSVRPKAVTSARSEEIVYKGTLDEVNQFFSEKGWTDGMGIMPPTREKVEQFLRFTDQGPDEDIAILPQENLRATPRNIAANAVMAGCRPEYMPLLIAAVEAVADPEFQLMNIGTTVCDNPYLLVNGPIMKQVGIEHGIGLASRGPSPAIGRALRLILRNIAGFKPGETAMATWGYFQPFVLGEDEEGCDEIGWEPYHVEHGFPRDASTVTARATYNWGFQAARPVGTDPGPILRCASEHQRRIIAPELSLKFGSRNTDTLLITRPTARVLAKGGYSKRDVAEYLWQHTRITGFQADQFFKNFTDVPKEKAISASYAMTTHLWVSEGNLPRWFDVDPDQSIPILLSKDLIDVVVCGDTSRNKMMTLWCTYNRPATRQIRFPARWEALLKEAKGGK
ncbi:MAG: hypothetical protein HYX92_02545 [Chloroflexi bacterium]|nr:hypothetical protein [Chloroflexota bacterium]